MGFKGKLKDNGIGNRVEQVQFEKAGGIPDLNIDEPKKLQTKSFNSYPLIA